MSEIRSVPKNVVVPNGYIVRQDGKMAIIKGGHYLDTVVTIFRQYLLENIHSTALGCAHEKWQTIVE